MACVGVFGGTFDPPHLAHLILAEEARAQLNLHRLLWVLTPTPPHKQKQFITSLEHRLAMLQLALADNKHFEVSTVDMERPAPHYAVDTLLLLSKQNPGVELVYIMGGDSLADLPRWYRPVDFLAACHSIAVMHRPGTEINIPDLERQIPGLGTKVCFIKAPLLEISSSDIRCRAAEGRPFRYFLPSKVTRYIQQHKLYRNPIRHGRSPLFTQE